MTRLATRDCTCQHRLYTGQKRPDRCPHGNLYLSEAQLNPKPRKPLQQVSESKQKQGKQRRSHSGSQPKRDWTDARAKVEQEGCCRICKRTDRRLEAAHVLGREHDEPKIGAGGHPLQELYVDPERIFPACGPSPEGCHGDVDMRRVNFLVYLTLEEQIRAVKDAGGIDAARMRLAPVEHREEIEASAYVPVA